MHVVVWAMGITVVVELPYRARDHDHDDYNMPIDSVIAVNNT
jgi:hypothetical protein